MLQATAGPLREGRGWGGGQGVRSGVRVAARGPGGRSGVIVTGGGEFRGEGWGRSMSEVEAGASEALCAYEGAREADDGRGEGEGHRVCAPQAREGGAPLAEGEEWVGGRESGRREGGGGGPAGSGDKKIARGNEGCLEGEDATGSGGGGDCGGGGRRGGGEGDGG